MKFDGYRALAFKASKEVRLVSRNQIDCGNDYPQLIDSLNYGPSGQSRHRLLGESFGDALRQVAKDQTRDLPVFVNLPEKRQGR